jgi:hypothetical protein
MADLSDMAKAIRTGMFMNPRATLTMHNEQSELTPEAAAAMQELIDGGYIVVEAQGKRRTYSLTDAGADLPRQSFDWMMTHGKKSLTQPIRKERSNG